MFDFDRDYEIATHPKDNSDIGAVESKSVHARSGAVQQSGHPIDNVRVRGVIINPASRQFLAMVNNRVMVNSRVTPGSMTVMLPGGAVEQGEGELSALARQIRDMRAAAMVFPAFFLAAGCLLLFVLLIHLLLEKTRGSAGRSPAATMSTPR